jgi:hypothetical protein
MHKAEVGRDDIHVRTYYVATHILTITAAMTTPSMLQQAKACMLVLTTHIFKKHDELAVDRIIKK